MDKMTMNLAGAASMQAALADARSPASKPATPSTDAEKVRPSEYYYSPKGKIDPSSGVYVIDVRDSESGEVVSKYPRKGAEGYRRAVEAARPAAAPAAPAAPPGDGGRTPAETASPSPATAASDSH